MLIAAARTQQSGQGLIWLRSHHDRLAHLGARPSSEAALRSAEMISAGATRYRLRTNAGHEQAEPRHNLVGLFRSPVLFGDGGTIHRAGRQKCRLGRGGHGRPGTGWSPAGRHAVRYRAFARADPSALIARYRCMARALKVFRTPIGFHDAYVAAPSQKAALEAWGSDANLFARGAAERVTDAGLMAEPLAHPGKVIRRPRGTTAEHLAALPRDKPKSPRPSGSKIEKKALAVSTGTDDRSSKSARSKTGAPSGRKTSAKPTNHKPRPSRKRLDAAEQALSRAHAAREAAIAEIRRREKALQEERRGLERRHDAQITKKEAMVAKEKEGYRLAMDRWRV